MTDRRRTSVSFLFLFACSGALMAQEEYKPHPPLPLGSTLLSLPSPHVAAAGLWETKFTHRFGEGGGDGLRSLWGLDNGANVTISLSWVPMRDLELSLTRSNVLDVYEVAAKYVVVQQAPAVPLSLSLRGGVDVRTERGINDRLSPFVQAIVGKRVTPRLELFALPTIALHAGRATVGTESYALFERAFNVPMGAAFHFGDGLSALVEVIPPNRELDGGDVAWSAGIKRAVGGHHFEIMITNSASTTVDEYVSSTMVGERLRAGAWRVGFNIERQFGKVRKPR